MGAYTVRIVDSPGFCDDHVTEEEHMKELGNGVMLAREGVHAIGLVLKVDNRFTGAEATVFIGVGSGGARGAMAPPILAIYTLRPA